MPVTTLKQALSLLPQVGFLNLYGQTEAIMSGLPRELHDVNGSGAADALRSVGFPFPGVRVRIVGDDDRDVEPGEPGEIVVRSDSLFRGYWDDPAATLSTLRDGWCRTGDIGRFDQRGLLYLVDRKKDIIITGGENVSSIEVEDTLFSHPAVAEVAIIGVPSEKWGETIKALVVLAPGQTADEATLIAHCKERLAGYKAPTSVEFRTEIPRTATGKIQKFKLREPYWADVERQVN
jgi:acyl-CoA synthetase (AMP-forming)/AMP-acid ligase II